MKVSLDGPPWGDVNPMTYTNKVINMENNRNFRFLICHV